MHVGGVVCAAFWKSWEESRAWCVSFSGTVQGDPLSEAGY